MHRFIDHMHYLFAQHITVGHRSPSLKRLSLESHSTYVLEFVQFKSEVSSLEIAVVEAWGGEIQNFFRILTCNT